MSNDAERHRERVKHLLFDINDLGRLRVDTNEQTNNVIDELTPIIAAKFTRLAELDDAPPHPDWYCPECKVLVPPENVTSDGHHWGCGTPIEVKAEPGLEEAVIKGIMPQQYGDIPNRDNLDSNEERLVVNILAAVKPLFDKLQTDIEKGRRYDEDIMTLKAVVKCGELALDKAVGHLNHWTKVLESMDSFSGCTAFSTMQFLDLPDIAKIVEAQKGEK